MSVAMHHTPGEVTVDEWLAMDQPEDGRRLELLWGELFLSPSPINRHQIVSGRLCARLDAALAAADRSDLCPVPAVGVRISTARHNGLIPDLVVGNNPSVNYFTADQLELVVEIWSKGNKLRDRQAKIRAYADAGVPFFWTVDFDKDDRPTITAYRLEGQDYVEDVVARPGEVTTIKAAPVPVTLDPADLVWVAKRTLP